MRTLVTVNKGPIGWIASIWRFVWDVALRWYYGRVGDLAASVTFWLLVSLPATVLALLAILGPIDRLYGMLFPIERGGVELEFQSRIQLEVSEFIGQILTDEGGEIQATITGLFSDTNAGLSLISGAFALLVDQSWLRRSDPCVGGHLRHRRQERRPWYITRVVAVFLGVGSVLLPLPLIVLDQFVWDGLSSNTLFNSLRTITLVAVLILWASIVYHFGPATTAMAS